MELFDQIRRISFVFFIIVGISHFLAGFMFINGYAVPVSGLMNRVLFIPFVLATVSYALSNLKYHMLEYGKNSKTLDYTFLTIGILVFLLLLSIELLVVDSPHPLTP